MARTILIVEDDADLRRLYRQALVIAGYDVREAGDGYDALRAVEQHTPDLIVLDLLLPTLNGYAVQQEIAAHAHTRSIPIVIVTGSELLRSVPDVECVLRKPVLPDDLVATVRRCLNAGAGSPH